MGNVLFMAETLYRKYRPRNFSEIIGQKHIVQTFENALKNDRVAQAYLFTGPRGTGKTSVARILAKTVNCENLKPARNATQSDAGGGFLTCEKCAACQNISKGKSLDIIEIDAASNTGVDNIRELRETVNLPPTSLKYKVYIIDEVHMLSTGAFNALLKTLEEPPKHVIFILATTEIHKVPSTIISRCQRFDFSRLPLQNIIEKLSLISKSEGIKINQESLEMIAISAEGGMRDAESLLGQIIALEDKNITIKEVEQILGTTDSKITKDIAEMIILNDSTGAIKNINDLLENGYDLQIFTKALINFLRQLMLLKVNPELESFFTYELTTEQIKEMQILVQKTELLKIITTINLFLEAQGKISGFILPQLPLEIAVIKATHTFPASVKVEAPTYQMQRNSQMDESPIISQKNSKQSSTTSLKPEKTEKNIPPEEINTTASKISLSDVKSQWPKLLEAIKPFNHSLKALLCNCQAILVKDNEITIATSYDFYKEKLNDPTNRLTIEQVFGKILGLKISIKSVTNKEAGITETLKNPVPEKESVQNKLLSSALEIIGGKVVSE